MRSLSDIPIRALQSLKDLSLFVLLPATLGDHRVYGTPGRHGRDRGVRACGRDPGGFSDRLGYLGRQVIRFNQLSFTKEHGSFERPFELANIAWPVVAPQYLKGRARQAFDFPACGQGCLAHEVERQYLNVLPSLTQGRAYDRNNLQPVVQVFAKPALPEHLLQVFVGSGNDPNVDFDRFGASYPQELAFLQYAEDLGLHGEARIPDLVQKQA